MIAKQTTIKFTDLQVRGLEAYAKRKGCSTTQAAVSSLVNDLPDFKELEAESMAARKKDPSHESYSGNKECQEKKGGSGKKMQPHESAA